MKYYRVVYYIDIRYMSAPPICMLQDVYKEEAFKLT